MSGNRCDKNTRRLTIYNLPLAPVSDVKGRDLGGFILSELLAGLARFHHRNRLPQIPGAATMRTCWAHSVKSVLASGFDAVCASDPLLFASKPLVGFRNQDKQALGPAVFYNCGKLPRHVGSFLPSLKSRPPRQGLHKRTVLEPFRRHVCYLHGLLA
jgi:hypothetical protein